MSFEEKTAKLTVKYAIEVKEGDVVYIIGEDIAADLIRSIYIEVLKAKGHPLVEMKVQGLGELKFKFGSNAQIKFYDPRYRMINEKADKLIFIWAEANNRSLQLVDPEKIQTAFSTAERLQARKVRSQREKEGKLISTTVPYPTNSSAQAAGCGLHSYKEFVSSALGLNGDPVKYWRDIEKKQDHLVRYLQKVDILHIIGEETDLTLSVKGRHWINCCGHKNLPDGEVFTGPIENSTEGHIRFTYPGIYMGNEIRDIYLEFKDGKVINASSSNKQDLLEKILEIQNADVLGEFAFGTNSNISEFSGNILFDEKIGGTIHLALGNGILNTGSSNFSSIHWDIVKDMRNDVSKIYADDTLIYYAGNWKI